jgi:hypothetical protein
MLPTVLSVMLLPVSCWTIGSWWNLGVIFAVKLAKESKRQLIRESISTSAAASEQLRKLAADQRNRRDQHAAVVSRELEGKLRYL